MCIRDRRRIYLNLLERKVKEISVELYQTMGVLEHSSVSLRKIEKTLRILSELTQSKRRHHSETKRLVKEEAFNENATSVPNDARVNHVLFGSHRIEAVVFLIRTMVETILPTDHKYFLTCADKGIDMFRDWSKKPSSDEFSYIFVELSKFLRLPPPAHAEPLKPARSKLINHKESLEHLVGDLDKLKQEVFDVVTEFDRNTLEVFKILDSGQFAQYSKLMEEHSQMSLQTGQPGSDFQFEGIDHRECRKRLSENLLCECIETTEGDDQITNEFVHLHKEMELAKQIAQASLRFISEKKGELAQGQASSLNLITKLIK
eukprot:TRINITY_DN7949_c0_g1_i2.p1 TRINITY_DN7949_c0_g1~~TRINITY_DN7949_c0_g1_i2.p1  ORF type:complete len:318 (+),score=30.54 TRINITY_DN7949_c0_g1_i2:64-1017(+)